jgi:hypothetical protein
VFDIVVIVPASMLLVCALARHWYTLGQIRDDIMRKQKQSSDELDKFKCLCL